MAWTQADLDTLSAAIIGGIKRVVYPDGRQVEYQTVADMRALRNDMKTEIAAATSRANPTPRTTIGRICR
jgi:hypothetical protein